MSSILRSPFPRPKKTRANILKILALGFVCSLFVIFFKPFGIENVTGAWYFNLQIFSIGVLFSLSIVLLEWGIPLLIPKPFRNWTLGKALIWYTLVILSVGATVFLYKSYLGGYRDFTVSEYFFVIGRTFLIALTVSFFVLGLYQYFNRKSIAQLTASEDYLVISKDEKPLKISLNNILYISSDDNYVNIHYRNASGRDKLLYRSTLKNIERQLVNPLSPMQRCHRKYIINCARFEISKKTSRSMIVKGKNFDDEIPVSAQYVDKIIALL